MIMGLETPVAMPTMNVYDTDLMKAYIAGVKEQYEQGQQEMKDFIKLYNDFYSPIEGDTERYHELTTGGAQQMINQIYANGMDPFKSPETRAAISRYINSVPTGKLNAMKQSAEAAQEYIKERGKLQAAGLYNPDYEDWLLGGRSLKNWNTETDGIWTRTSPGQFQNIEQFTDDWFKHSEKKFNPELTKRMNDGFDYYTYDDNDLRAVISGKLDDVIKDGGIGQYYYDKFFQLAGKDADKARELFTREIISRNNDYHKLDRKENPYTLDSRRTANDIWAYKQKAKTDFYYDQLKNNPDSPYYTGSKSNSGEYSHYQQISSATNYNVQDQVKKIADKASEKGKSVVFTDEVGKQIIIRRVYDKDGNARYLIPDESGSIKSKSGQTYRIPTEKELQQALIQNTNSKNWWDKIAVNDQSNTFDESFSDSGFTYTVEGDDNKEHSKINPAMLKYIYTKERVGNNAYGRKNSSSNDDLEQFKKDLEDAQDVYVDYNYRAADVHLNGDRKTKYLEVRFKYKPKDKSEWETRTELVKIGEYELVGNEWHPTQKWASRMMPSDSRVSGDINSSVGVKPYPNIK